ncbi:hypothetical protein BDQ17DRAFT_1325768 [Cyathus striatus]|nr:hypothetical protein BDQ17DRAFT_1325768 [Cyathus striatus]
MEDVNTNYGLSPMLCNLIANTIMPLPLPIDQVRSTYVPGPSDISAIQNSVECSEMALRSMEVQLPRIRKFYALQRSLLAPIRKLPDNVLGEIFIHVMGGYAIDIGARDGKIWALLQVCARWRKVVESTPALWNKFHVGKKEIRQETMSHRIEITDFLHWIQPIKPSQTPKVGPALRKLIVKGRSTMFARNRKNVHMDNCSNEFMINTINAIPDVEKLTLQMPAADSPTKNHKWLLPLVKNVLVEEVLKSRSSGLDKSVEGSPSSDLDESFEGSPRPTALLSYVKLSMEVPQSYYEECTSPDTKLCMDEIKALASESSMEIDFDIRVAEIGEYITEVEEERVMSEKIKIRNVSDDEDDGIWW